MRILFYDIHRKKKEATNVSEPRLISPMLDNFIMGGPISDHHGVRCCPAMENETDDKYIVKVISVPASAAQVDALLLTGAYPDEASALAYFKELAEVVLDEVKILDNLSEQEGFISFSNHQVEPMEDDKGFDIYLLGRYRRTLEKHFKRHDFTHLDALNLGLDLCAALSVCRRSGYLYVDLKPSNVFVTEQQQYRIGDLGFIRLNGLKYASLPEKYLSVYTPPEISDAYSSLNETMDVYAAGLILYQVFNNGVLPFNDEIQPGDELPAPAYADHEMSQIILKACAANPEDRFSDPIAFGQAIVGYMQRNGASDALIVPAAKEEPIVEQADESPVSVCETAEGPAEDTAVTETAPVDPEVAEWTELSNDNVPEEEVPEDAPISDEVLEILDQADELAAAAVPDPVVVPDHIDVDDIPLEPFSEEEEPEENDEETDEEEPIDLGEVSDEDTDEEVPEPAKPVKKRRWVGALIAIIVVAALLVGGYFFYKEYYLVEIGSLSVESDYSTLTVLVTTDEDESILQVSCTSTYGTPVYQPVVDGKAVFKDLMPNTAYSIKLTVDGFHKLKGTTTAAFATPIPSNIVQIDAVAGVSDGSVILNFTLEGPDSEQWTVLYSAEGEDERSATFAGHSVTLTDLTVDKEYTFKLSPEKELYVTGTTELTYKPRLVVRAEKLEVISCMNNALTVKWSAPDGMNVDSWTVRCTGADYSKTIVTTDTMVTFDELDHTMAYNIEVKAAGMSVNQTTSIPANSVTASNFVVDASSSKKLVVMWETSTEVPEDGWVLCYSVEGVNLEDTIACKENMATITPVLKDSTYHFRLEDTKGNILLGSKVDFVTTKPAQS